MKSISIETIPLLNKNNNNNIKIQNNNINNNKTKLIFNYIVYFILLFFFIIFIILYLNNNNNYNNIKLNNSNIKLNNNYETVSVYKNIFTNRYEIIRGRKDLISDAMGTFQMNVEGGGWNYLEIEATPQDDSMDKYLQSMKAMGYIEGYLTWQQIEQYYPNYYQGMFDTEDPEPVDPDIRVQKYLLDNFIWMSEKSKLKCYESAHWLTVRGIVEQLEGLLDGFIDGRQEYNRIHKHNSIDDDDDHSSNNNNEDNNNRDNNGDYIGEYKNLNGNIDDNTHLTTLKKPYLLHFLILNGNGDLIQITEKIAAMDEAVQAALQEENKLNNEELIQKQDDKNKIKKRSLSTSSTEKIESSSSTTEIDLNNITPLSLMKSKRSEDHCSAFIKVFPDQSDVVFAHNTWDDYRNMAPRIFKHYIFPPWPTELKKEERKKDTFLKYTAQPSSTKSKSSKSKHHKEHEKDTKSKNDIDENKENDDKDHCLCPLTQYSKKIDKSDNSDSNGNGNSKSESYQYHFSPHSYFSSSPGVLTSVDDFYTTYTSPNIHIEENKNKNCYCEGPGGRLGIMETSLDVKSPELYDKIIPQSLLSWIRVRSANLIAIDGNDWVSRFSYDHSGTYANQWMVIDFTKFHEVNQDNNNNNNNDNNNNQQKQPQKVLDEGFLTIVEEMPGMIHSGDETQHILSNGYWASYNEPYYKELADYSGNTEYCESTRLEYSANHDINDIYGLWPGEVNCFETCSRARLFNRLQSSVNNIHDAMSLITYNNYQQDKESFGDSCESISCREDLEPSLNDIRAFGAIDAKVSSVLRSDIYRENSSPQRPISHASVSSFHHIYPREPEFFIHQGPTSSGQEPFCWDKFETKQNNYYNSVQNIIKNSLNQIGNLVQSGNYNDEDDDNDDDYSDDKNNNIENDNNNIENDNNNNQIKLRGLLNKEKNNNKNDKSTKNEKNSAPQRNRRPSIQYSHEGHPNCFDYDWVIVPPDNTKL